MNASRFICTLFIFAAAALVQAAAPKEHALPRIQWGSGPIRYQARSLFDPALQLTSDQQKFLTRIDAIELRGFSVCGLRPSEVVSAIRDCLAEAHMSDIVIRATPNLDASDARIEFSKRDMRLANALKYLSLLGGVSYTLSGTEIVVGRFLSPK